jgi:hypothetical protein
MVGKGQQLSSRRSAEIEINGNRCAPCLLASTVVEASKSFQPRRNPLSILRHLRDIVLKVHVFQPITEARFKKSPFLVESADVNITVFA